MEKQKNCIWTNVVVVWLQTTTEDEDSRTNGSPGDFWN